MNYFYLCMFIVISAVVASILFRLYLKDVLKESDSAYIKRNATFLSTCGGSLFSVIFIKLFGKCYTKVAILLTNQENPRTQEEYDRSYIYKRFLLSFANNYAAMVYVTFVKGKTYTFPGDEQDDPLISTIRSDVCHPAGCLMGVCVQLAFIMLFKSLAGNIFSLIVPACKRCFRKVVYDKEDLPRWEENFKLNEVGKYFLVGEYMEMLMQFGFVTFFASAFPLAPLCALINNLLELRTDANKYIRNSRRPVPVKNVNLGAWIVLLKTMTEISIVVNAFIIAFTSDFVKRILFQIDHDTLEGFIDSSLSEYTRDGKTCFYPGSRESVKPYGFTRGYWKEICMRFIAAVIFEHFCLLFSGILSKMIPDTPYSVKAHLRDHHDKVKETRILAMQDVTRGTNIFHNK